MNNKLWHKPSEIPQPKSSIILVHHYFDRQSVDTAYVQENNYKFNLDYPRNNNWYDWEWRMEKWCYIEDLLKIK